MVQKKLEIVSGAAPPPFRIFALLRFSASDGQAGGLPRCLRRRNAFGLIQEYCVIIIFHKIQYFWKIF